MNNPKADTIEVNKNSPPDAVAAMRGFEDGIMKLLAEFVPMLEAQLTTIEPRYVEELKHAPKGFHALISLMMSAGGAASLRYLFEQNPNMSGFEMLNLPLALTSAFSDAAQGLREHHTLKGAETLMAALKSMGSDDAAAPRSAMSLEEIDAALKQEAPPTTDKPNPWGGARDGLS